MKRYTTGLPCSTSKDASILWQAAVVCRQLGFGAVAEVKVGSHFGNVFDPFSINNVGCYGSETSLNSCSYDDSAQYCASEEVAGVVCVDGTPKPGNALTEPPLLSCCSF